MLSSAQLQISQCQKCTLSQQICAHIVPHEEDGGGVSCPSWLGCVFGCRVHLATMHFCYAIICICNF